MTSEESHDEWYKCYYLNIYLFKLECGKNMPQSQTTVKRTTKKEASVNRKYSKTCVKRLLKK